MMKPIEATPALRDRLMAKVDRTGECWEWTGYRNPQGYGRLHIGADGPFLAHRVSYTVHVGPIPDGLDLDHLCRNPSCANPAHLEPVTRRENSLRGTSPSVVLHRDGKCKRGHDLEPGVECRPCGAMRAMRRLKQKEAADPSLREARLERMRRNYQKRKAQAA